MNVALITLEGGGISTVCYGLASSLSKRKIPTTIFTETSGMRQTQTVNEFLHINRLHRLELPPRFFWFQLQNFGIFSGWLGRYTLVHGVSPDAATLYALHKKKGKGKPFVVSFHAEPLSNANRFLKTPFSSWIPSEFAHHILEYPLYSYNLRRCIRSADHIILCSFSTLAEFQAAYKDLNPENVSVIYNSVDFDEINDVQIGMNNSEHSGSSILFTGRLFWLKGPMLLLKAFEILRKDIKNVDLKIFGSGPEEKRLKKFVSLSGMAGHVHIYGRIPHRDLIAEIKKSDVVVAPSLYEAQSLFVLEAMACGKPLVAFDIPAMKEIITNGFNGILAKSFDVCDLAKQIQVVLSDKKLRSRIGQNAFNYVKLKHNWDRQIDKYIEVYETVTDTVAEHG